MRVLPSFGSDSISAKTATSSIGLGMDPVRSGQQTARNSPGATTATGSPRDDSLNSSVCYHHPQIVEHQLGRSCQPADIGRLVLGGDLDPQYC